VFCRAVWCGCTRSDGPWAHPSGNSRSEGEALVKAWLILASSVRCATLDPVSVSIQISAFRPGLLVGIEFDSDIAGDVMGKLIEAGVLMNAPAGNILRFMPPLVLTEDEVDEVVGKLATALDEVKAKTPA